MNFGIIVFPGSNCDHDCFHVVTSVLGHQASFIWHKEEKITDVDCLILPGGFSYGDYLRSGAMAACSPVMTAVKKFASDGGLVLGICNGFQILQEARLLPASLIRNANLKFVCKDVHIRAMRNDTPFTCDLTPGEVLKMPIAHMDGNFFVDKRTLTKLENEGQLLFRYSTRDGHLDSDSNPNGSMGNVAAVMNKDGNVCGLMPHPERCSELLLGNTDGIKIFKSIISWHEKKARR